MGRPLRWLKPETTWFATSRCDRAHFLLRPDPEATALFGYWLARALERFPTVRLLGAIGMSNHIHAIVKDADGSLSDFMCYFLGNLAKGVNDLRQRTGNVFHRRFSAEPIIEPDAVQERLLYLLANPVAAGLVYRSTDWPGVVLWASSGRPEQHTFRVFDHDAFAVAKAEARKTGEKLKKEKFWIEATLTVHPLEDDDGSPVDPETIKGNLKTREAEIRRERGAKPVLGREKLLAQSVEAGPKRPKRSPRPLCHSTLDESRRAFKAAYRTFANFYRQVSLAYRAGHVRLRFPDYSFPPWRPLVVPDTA